MAQIKLTKNWEALSVTTGTIQNLSAAYNVEISEDNTDGTGQVLMPGEAFSFSSVQLYARVISTNADDWADVRVSPFVDAVGGSSGGSGGGSSTPYVLPTASAAVKGGIKVGTGLSIDSNAVLSADAPTPYTLPTASSSTLGGVKVGNNLSIDASGKLSATSAYTLPTMSATEKGGAKLGDGLKVAGEILSVDTGKTAGQVVKIESDGKIDSSILPAIATNDTYVVASQSDMLALNAGVGDICVRSDESKSYILQKTPATTLANWIYLQSPTAAVQSVNGKTGAVTIAVPTKVSELTNDSGYISSVATASTTEKGVVKVGTGLSIDANGVLSTDGTIPTASATTKGGVKIGNGLTMTGEVLSADAVNPATTTTLGGIIVGDNLTIDATGKLSANAGGYTLPKADASTLGGIKVGTRLSVDSDGVLSADDQTAGLATVATTGKYTDLTDTPAAYVLPTASAAIKGGVKIGSNVDVDGNGVISVADADGITAGVAKLYTATGENTDGAMSQKAVKDALGTKLNSSAYNPAEIINDTTASTSTVYSASKVDTKLGGYLPTSGGTLSGAVISGGDDKNLFFASGSNADGNKGAYVILRGKSVADNGGAFTIASHDGTSEKSLIGKADGTLTWDGNNVITSAGGTITSTNALKFGDCGSIYSTNGASEVAYTVVQSDNTIGSCVSLRNDEYTDGENTFYIRAGSGTHNAILYGKQDGTLTWGGKNVLTSDGILVASSSVKRASDAGYIELYGGSGYQKGAMLSLSGKDRDVITGSFYLRADNGTNAKELRGFPDGTLTWNNESIVTKYADFTGTTQPDGNLKIALTGVDTANIISAMPRVNNTMVMMVCGWSGYAGIRLFDHMGNVLPNTATTIRVWYRA